MKRPSSFLGFSSLGKRSAQSVTDFLSGHEKLGALLPAAARLVKLQQDCASLVPGLFAHCAVSQPEAGQLLILTPSAALASRLKQQLPKLQEGLAQRGWQVNAIRLKVQVGNIPEKSSTSKRLLLSNRAVSAFAQLQQNLDDTPRNEGLKQALSALLERHR